MSTARGAPKKPVIKAKSELIQLRINAAEKEAFKLASESDGKKLSEWIRDRLRKCSREELQSLGLAVPFLPLPHK